MYGAAAVLCPVASEHRDELSAIVDAGTRLGSVGSYSSTYTVSVWPAAAPGAFHVASPTRTTSALPK